jgi:hypothetical protein
MCAGESILGQSSLYPRLLIVECTRVNNTKNHNRLCYPWEAIHNLEQIRQVNYNAYYNDWLDFDQSKTSTISNGQICD